MYTRRTFLKLSAIFGILIAGNFFYKGSGSKIVRHILPSVSHNKIAISVSLFDKAENLEVKLDNQRIIKGNRIDRDGTHWQFIIDNLQANRSYQLELFTKQQSIFEAWNLNTFPDSEAEIENVSFMAFTCSGGGDGFKSSGREFFKPFSFRQKLFKEGLSKQPDFAIAIGDHVYWDLRGEDSPPVGRNSKLIKFFLGGYLKLRYGVFDRTVTADSKNNEEIIKKIGNEQIADLYGTIFKSTPIFFIPDDHDYFENDDAEEDIVTFPADEFSKSAFKKMADLFYPPLLDTPNGVPDRRIGRVRYGRAFEGLMADCAGNMTLGNQNAVLISNDDEKWIRRRIKTSNAEHLAFIPSHPLGYTAGKWREWYPDIVAEEGASGTVVNELLSGLKGILTTEVDKFLWQKGWFMQHQRLLKELSDRSRNRFIFSGDIHAIGASTILESKDLVLNKEIKTFLVGPVSSSTGTWPSFARGISAESPEYIQSRDIFSVLENNGFTIFHIEGEKAVAEIISCGGHNPELGETGKIVSETLISI